MPWSYKTWILSNVLSTVIIFLLVFATLFVILWRIPKHFYGTVERLFRIQRCTVDVNHQIVKTNSEVFSSDGEHHDIHRLLSKAWNVKEKFHSSITSRTGPHTHPRAPITVNQSKPVQVWDSPHFVVYKNVVEETNHRHKYRCTPTRSDSRGETSHPTARETIRRSQANTPSSELYTTFDVDETHPSHPAYERLILNVYGKYLPLRKKRNRFLILLISSIVITAVIIAFCEGCLLASSSVYLDGPCPTFGDMECFDGTTKAYFECKVGQNINAGAVTRSGVCFRLIARDQSISTLLTQLGICAGLIVSFGSVTEFFIRILFWVYKPRLAVGNGIRRVLEKTVGINNVTQPICMCCVGFPIRIPPPNLGLYRYPVGVVLVTLGYLALAVMMVVAYIPLLHYQLSVTSYTYIVLISVALLCFFTLIWIVWEVDEISRVLPGACTTFKDIFDSKAFQETGKFFKDFVIKTRGKEDEEKNKSKEKDKTSKFASDVLGKLKERASSYFKSKKQTLPPAVLRELAELTNFSEQEIKEWHAGFMRDCPTGELDRKKFMREFRRYFVKDDRASKFRDYFFHKFNTDKAPNDTINFAEFLVAISSKTQDKLENRIEIAFDMYDISGSKGTIDQRELTLWIKAMYDVSDIPSRGWAGQNDPKQVAERIIQDFDKDGDKELTKQEFLDGCREHPELMAILSPPHQTQPTKTQPISIESNSIAQKNTRKASKDAR